MYDMLIDFCLYIDLLTACFIYHRIVGRWWWWW